MDKFIKKRKKVNSLKLTKKVWRDPVYFIAFGFGSGLMPFAPGTWGTLVAVPIYLLLAPLSLLSYLIVLIFAFVAGVEVSKKVTKDLGAHDYSGIVWDEVVGFLLTMTAIPAKPLWIILGFFLFRLFDIWKPEPIRSVDRRVGGGLGIMLDDVLAAVPAWLILQFLIRVLPV